MKSDRYWITVSCQDFEQEFFDEMTEFGMKELEPEKDFSLRLLFRTTKKNQAIRMLRLILRHAEVHDIRESLKVHAVTQPICSACGAFNKFSMAGKTCFKCGGQVSMKKDVLIELLTGTEKERPKTKLSASLM